jgi:hypothetical protein
MQNSLQIQLVFGGLFLFTRAVYNLIRAASQVKKKITVEHARRIKFLDGRLTAVMSHHPGLLHIPGCKRCLARNAAILKRLQSALDWTG